MHASSYVPNHTCFVDTFWMLSDAYRNDTSIWLNWINVYWTAYTYVLLSFQQRLDYLTRNYYVKTSMHAIFWYDREKQTTVPLRIRMLLKLRSYDGSYSFVFIRDILLQPLCHSKIIPIFRTDTLLNIVYSCSFVNTAGKQCNNDVIMTSKRRRDVVLTS